MTFCQIGNQSINRSSESEPVDIDLLESVTCIFDWLIINSTDFESWADEQSKLKSKLKLRFITDLLLAQSKAGEGGGVGAGGQLSLHQTMLLVPQVLISSLNPAPFSPLPLTVFWRVGFFSYLRGVGIIGANNWMQIISKLIPCQKLCTNFLPILLVVFHFVFIIFFFELVVELCRDKRLNFQTSIQPIFPFCFIQSSLSWPMQIVQATDEMSFVNPTLINGGWSSENGNVSTNCKCKPKPVNVMQKKK